MSTTGQAGTALLWVIIATGLLVGGGLYYGYTRPQDVPVWMRDWLPGLPEYTGPLYRWHDAKGRLQVTDQPPRDRPYEIIQYRRDTNTVPSKAR